MRCGLLGSGLAIAVLAGCNMQSDEAKSDPAASGSASKTAVAIASARPGGSGSGNAAWTGQGPVRFVPAPADGDVASIVKGAMSEAKAGGRTLLVYAGATWCGPCQKFHEAAKRGDVDPLLPGLTLLEFDVDRDRERLLDAGYHSTYIPLFVVPGDDGRSTGRQIEGGIKGDGAVSELVPRIRKLVAGG